MKKWAIIIGTIVALMMAYLGYRIYITAGFLQDLGPCGFSVGPYEGKPMDGQVDTTLIDIFLGYPNGLYGFMHAFDSLPPIMVKMDDTEQVIWAIELSSSDSSNWIPFEGLNNPVLYEDEHGKRIFFSNNSFPEPGTIYLTDDYNFDYVCLNPM